MEKLVIELKTMLRVQIASYQPASLISLSQKQLPRVAEIGKLGLSKGAGVGGGVTLTGRKGSEINLFRNMKLFYTSSWLKTALAHLLWWILSFHFSTVLNTSPFQTD